MLTRSHLHPYQLECIEHLEDNPFSALYIDVGLGKSIISLTAIANALNRGDTGRWLVIAPLRVARATWPEEIKEWKQATGIEHTLIRAEDSDDDIRAVYKEHYDRFYAAERRVGETPRVATRNAARKASPYRQAAKEAKRQRLALEDTELHIINVEQLVWLVEFWEERGRTTGERWPYVNVILDESSKFKDPSTKRWKALNKARGRMKRLHQLTASPASEHYEGLFAQLFLMDRGKRLGNSMHSYHKKYFHEIRKAHKWKLRPGSDKRISERIADICKVVKLADVRDYVKVEDWVPIKRRIVLPTDIQQRYRNFERDFILELDDDIIEAMNAGALFNKLLQLSAGAVYDAEKNVRAIHDEKIEDLKELIEELGDTPIMVTYWFQSTLARLKKAFPEAVVMDREAKCKDAWNAGKIKILLVHPASAGHGLNLQKGPGHDIAIFDPFYSRELYEQVIGRLARQGQRKLVRVWQLTCVDTYDELVYECLEDKHQGQERLFKFIRAARARFANDNERRTNRVKAA
ncbi:MAG: DEAD/DEAH box helicase [Desulfurellales bacterium]|nr:MAG: DEAD/DEAH box helicase [Desulfurellales bacterium]